jgi:hypothetical protein
LTSKPWKLGRQEIEVINSRPTLRRVDFQGLPVNVEIEPGTTKSGVDERGQAWSHVYKFPYGEILGTDGADGDPVDCYLGPDPAAPDVYVVHQRHQNLDGAGGFYDEDKVFLGFASMSDAFDAYYDHGPAWGMGGATVMDMPAFKEYLADKRGPLRGWNPQMFGATP